MHRLSEQHEEINRYTRSKNLIIAGIPEKENEDPYELVKALASTLGVKCSDADGRDAHRLPSRHLGRGSSRSMVCGLSVLGNEISYFGLGRWLPELVSYPKPGTYNFILPLMTLATSMLMNSSQHTTVVSIRRLQICEHWVLGLCGPIWVECWSD